MSEIDLSIKGIKSWRYIVVTGGGAVWSHRLGWFIGGNNGTPFDFDGTKTEDFTFHHGVDAVEKQRQLLLLADYQDLEIYTARLEHFNGETMSYTIINRGPNDAAGCSRKALQEWSNRRSGEGRRRDRGNDLPDDGGMRSNR